MQGQPGLQNKILSQKTKHHKPAAVPMSPWCLGWVCSPVLTQTVQGFVFFFFWSWSEPKEAFPGICASLLFLLKFPPTPQHIYTTWLLIYQVADVLFEYKTTPANVILIMQKLTAMTKMNII